MAKSRRKIPPPDMAAAASWRGQILRDAFENRLGIVHTIEKGPDGVFLLARFQDESEDRVVWLEPRDDGQYVFPDDPHARYRPLLDEEMASRKKNS